MTLIYLILYSFVWWQILAIIALSSGYHRYFSHQSFKAPVWYEYVVLLLGPLSGTGPVMGWAGVHRMHHALSDTDKDPHSPIYKNFWRVLTSTFSVDDLPSKYFKDFFKNKRITFFYEYHIPIRVGTFVLGFLFLPLFWFLVLIVSPMFWGRVSFGLVNTVGHWYGKPRDSLLVNVLLGGEGAHKYHHDNPGSYRISKYWDPTGWFIGLIRIKKEKVTEVFDG